MREFHFSQELEAPLVSVIVSGPKGAFRLRLIFDTGSHATQLSKAAVSTLGFGSGGGARKAFAVGVGGAREEGFEVLAPRLFVLGRKFQNVPICAFEMKYLDQSGSDGLLGWDLIKQLHLEMDGPNGVLKVF